MATTEPQPATPKRELRWYQYKLRSLLILTLALALVLSAVYSWPHVQRRVYPLAAASLLGRGFGDAAPRRTTAT